VPPPETSGLHLGEQPEGYRSGFVSLVGRPNVGKSTLLNQILRSKVAITSERPQTTRNAIRGVYTMPDAQLVFVDTPGLHKPRTALGKQLNRVVRTTLEEVDVIVFVVDAAQGVGAGDAFVAAQLEPVSSRVILAVNKIDLMDWDRLGPQMAKLRELCPDPVLIPISAKTGSGTDELIAEIVKMLPAGPLYYPPDVVTDQPTQQMLAELIREKALELTREEVPHSIAVVINEIETADDGERVTIDATIYVERDSQKGIVIGKGGSMLKEIGTRGRRDIELALGTHVFLELRVKVERDWQRSDVLVERFGYGS
jgi:GTPase